MRLSRPLTIETLDSLFHLSQGRYSLGDTECRPNKTGTTYWPKHYNATLSGLLELTDEVNTDDFDMHDPTMPGAIRGREGLPDHYRTFESAFPMSG